MVFEVVFTRDITEVLASEKALNSAIEARNESFAALEKDLNEFGILFLFFNFFFFFFFFSFFLFFFFFFFFHFSFNFHFFFWFLFTLPPRENMEILFAEYIEFTEKVHNNMTSSTMNLQMADRLRSLLVIKEEADVEDEILKELVSIYIYII